MCEKGKNLDIMSIKMYNLQKKKTKYKRSFEKKFEKVFKCQRFNPYNCTFYKN